MLKRDTKGRFFYRSVDVGIDRTAVELPIVPLQKEITELQEKRTVLLRRYPRPSLNPFFVLIPFLGCLIVSIGYIFSAGKIIDSFIASIISFLGGGTMIISGLAIGLAMWFASPKTENWKKTTGIQIKSFDEQIAAKNEKIH